MRRLIATLVCAAATLPLIAAAQTAPRFEPAAIEAHVTFLADDKLAGRKSGTRDYAIAADYVAAQFRLIGAAPLGDAARKSYFQMVPLREARAEGGPVMTIAGKQALRFDKADQVLLQPSLVDGQQRLSAQLVFVGYGMDRPDMGLNDYAGLDLTGKIAIALTGYPKGLNTEIGAHLNSDKARMAAKRGAIGLLTIPTLQDTARRPWARRMEMSGEPRSTWAAVDGVPFVRVPEIKLEGTLNPESAAALFPSGARSLASLLKAADRAGGKPRGFDLAQTATVERTTAFRPYSSANVIAMIPGSDPALAGEYVLMTAHLDHIGVHGTGADKINNGAMDNAAGVATMLEVARALARDPVRPRRPVVFAALTNEETGLIGADYLARNGVGPLGRAVAVVNFDMPILTYPFTDVVAFGAENSTLGPMVAAAAGRAGVTLSPDPLPAEGLFTRSDHYRFVQQGVPAVFLMTGFAGPGKDAFTSFLATHYHRPSDDLNLPIDWAAGAKFAAVNYEIVRAIADSAEAPRWYAGNFFGSEFAPSSPKAQPVKK